MQTNAQCIYSIIFFTEIIEIISVCLLPDKDLYKLELSYHILDLLKSLQEKMHGILYLPLYVRIQLLI